MWRGSRKSKKVFLVFAGLYLTAAFVEALLSTGWISELAVPLSLALMISGGVWALASFGDRRSRKKEALQKQLDAIDERLGITKQGSGGGGESETQSPPVNPATPYLPKKTKANLALGCVAIPTSLALFVGLVSAIGNVAGDISWTANDVQSETLSEEPIDTESKYFGSQIVPLFVGYSAESAVRMLDSEFNERFRRIVHSETGDQLSTYYSRERDFEDLEGLFVCEQSIGAGVLVEYARQIGSIKLEVSESCAGEQPALVGGAAAELLGRYVPPQLNLSDCNSSAESCKVRELDGRLIDFLDKGYNGHKTALVQTIYGDMEVELAMIDLASEWCSVNDQNESEMVTMALALRDELLPNGTLIRMVGGDELYGGRRLVHVLDEQGTLVDGQIPINSVNEQLVASGYWVPLDISEHPWERIYSFYQEDYAEPTWTRKRTSSSTSTPSEELMSQYADRINNAANNSFSEPNAQLAGCLQEKNDQVVVLLSEKEEEEREEEERRNRWAEDVEAVWRSVFCPTRADEYPERCASYDPAKDDLVGTGGGSGSSGGSSGGSSWGNSGGGTNCTYVNGYTRRDGTRVSGYYRCG